MRLKFAFLTERRWALPLLIILIGILAGFWPKWTNPLLHLQEFEGVEELYQQGFVQLKEGEADRAEADWQAALDYYPPDLTPALLHNLALLRIQKATLAQQPSEAVELMGKARQNLEDWKRLTGQPSPLESFYQSTHQQIRHKERLLWEKDFTQRPIPDLIKELLKGEEQKREWLTLAEQGNHSLEFLMQLQDFEEELAYKNELLQKRINAL